MALETSSQESLKKQSSFLKQRVAISLVYHPYNFDRTSASRVDDWVIQRKEIDVKGRKFFGAGTKGAVEVKLRGSREAVKLMDEMRRLLPHHRHMYEQAMVNASYCYHPKFIGATNDDDIRPLLVNELLDPFLRFLLLRQSLSVAEITTIALDIAKGLHFLHRKRPYPVVHGNINSVTVLVRREDKRFRAKLSD